MMEVYIWILYFINCIVVISAQTECDTRADIVFMIDMSTSIREKTSPDSKQDNWQIVKDFVTNVTKQLPIRQDAMRVGAIKFSRKVDEDDKINLGDYIDGQHLKEKINDLKFLGGGTNTSGAIRYMASHPGLFGPGSAMDRPDVQNFGILITDGLSNLDPEKTKPEARKAKIERNIKIFTIGITQFANKDELQEIASDPVAHYHFVSEDFMHLNLLIDDLLLGLCRQKPPPSTPCRDTRADVAFIMDSSGSIGNESWTILKKFVVAVMDSLDLSDTQTRVAVVSYSTEPVIVFGFEKYFGPQKVGNLQDMKKEMMDLPYLDDRTNIAAALKLMREGVFNINRGDRLDVKNIGILISDGKSTDDINQTSIEARLIEHANIKMFALGLTNDIDQKELTTIASEPHSEHFLNATEISQVSTLQAKLIWGICLEKCGDSSQNPSCWRNRTMLGCAENETPKWVRFEGHILLGNNYDRLESITSPRECQDLCYRDPRCRSVDYVAIYQQCAVSYVTRLDAPDSFVTEANADYYELMCDSMVPTGPGIVPDQGGDPATVTPTKATSGTSTTGNKSWTGSLLIFLLFSFWRI